MTPRILSILALAVALTGCADAFQPPPSRCGGPVMGTGPSSRDEASLWQKQLQRRPQPIAPTPPPPRRPQPAPRPDVWPEHWGG
jgi:hypothetical protein